MINKKEEKKNIYIMEKKFIKEMLSSRQRVFYCPVCGEKFSNRHDGEKERPFCTRCQTYYYENPAVGVAAVIFDVHNRILLGRRNRGRKKGYWCIPCGYVDYDEDLYDAVVREFKEETNLDIRVGDVIYVRSNFFPPGKHSVGIWFSAQVTGGDLKAQDDLSQVGYFHLNSLPEMAFNGDLKVIDKIKKNL